MNRVSSNNFSTFAPMWHNDRVSSDIVDHWLRQWHVNLAHDSYAAQVLQASVFYFRTLGLTVPIALLAVLLLETPLQRRFYWASWSIFVCASLIRFQPWKNDNIKVYYVWLMVQVGMIGMVLLHRRRSWPMVLRVLKLLVSVVLLVMLIGSGTLALIRESNHFYSFHSPQDRELGHWARTNMPDDAVVIVSNRHNHPICNIAGKSLLNGYDGWLYSHGYPDLHQRQQHQTSILNGDTDADMLLQRYNVRYVVLDHALQDLNMRIHGPRARLVFNNQAFRVYDLFPMQESFVRSRIDELQHDAFGGLG
jgi:hypothetical protein